MNSIRAAIYARVSSEQQATAHTIESQLAALTERAQADGHRYRWSDSFSTTDTAVLHSFVLQWIVCAIWLPSAASIAFMSTHPTDWPATTPIKFCSSMSGVALVSKSFS